MKIVGLDTPENKNVLHSSTFGSLINFKALVLDGTTAHSLTVYTEPNTGYDISKIAMLFIFICFNLSCRQINRINIIARLVFTCTAPM